MGAVLASCTSAGGRSARDQILGSWELESRTVRQSNGDVITDPVLGQKPAGRLFYDGSGYMALQMMRMDRQQAISQPSAPEQAKNARIVLGYDAYFGSFTVDESAGTVTHHIVGSLFPEDLGKEFTRNFRVSGDTFELSFESPGASGTITRTLVFRRSR